MELLELNLDPEGVPDWVVWHGVREKIQNWADNPEESSWTFEGGVLTLTNANTKVSRSMFLQGHSGKRDNSDSIGRHGDGVKSAMVCLLREGKDIKYFNDDIMWTPVLHYSDTYEKEVVCVEEEILEEGGDGCFSVVISGITDSEFEEIKDNYLGFQEDYDIIYQGEKGGIVSGAVNEGRIYCNGLFVCHFGNMDYGYNFKPRYLQLDRDRQTVRSFDVKWMTKDLMSGMIRQSKDIVPDIVDNIVNKKGDTEYMEHTSVPEVLKDAVYEKFQEEHGDSFIATSQEECNKLKKDGHSKVVFTGNEVFASIVRKSSGYKSLDFSKVKVKTPKELLDEHKDKWYDSFCTDMLDDYNELTDKIVDNC